MKIIVDDREKTPWTWTFQPKGFFSGTLRRRLKTGDYTVDGYEDEVCVERKSLDDLVGTVIHNRDRWHKELNRMAGITKVCVVVESSLSALLTGCYKSKAHPNSVLGLLMKDSVKHNLPVFFADSPMCAAELAERWLKQAVGAVTDNREVDA